MSVCYTYKWYINYGFYPCDVVSGVFATAMWLAGCLSQLVLYQND